MISMLLLELFMPMSFMLKLMLEMGDMPKLQTAQCSGVCQIVMATQFCKLRDDASVHLPIRQVRSGAATCLLWKKTISEAA